MDSQRVVVVVEEAAASRAAVEWAVRNLLRGGDCVTLVHVYPSTRSKNKRRNYRLRGFQLALSFKDLCNGIAEAKVEIIVMEGDEGTSVVSLVNRIGASVLVVGLHDRSFLYKIPILNPGIRSLNCRIIALKPHSKTHGRFMNIEFSQVEIARLCVPEAKNSLLDIFPLSLCRRRKRRRGEKECPIYRGLHQLKRPNM